LQRRESILRRRAEVAARRPKKAPNQRAVVRLEAAALPGVLPAVLPEVLPAVQQVARRVELRVVPRVARQAVLQAGKPPAPRKREVRDAAADVAAGKRLRLAQPTRRC